MCKELKERKDIDQAFKWDLSSMYENEGLWQADIDKSIKLSEEFSRLSGRILDSSESLKKALLLRDEMWQIIEKAFVFSRMKRDEDNTLETSQAICDKAGQAIAKISAASSFFIPEILKGKEEDIMTVIEEDAELAPYKFAIENIFRKKEHVLSSAEENIMAQMSELNSATNNIFTLLNNADLTFDPVTDKEEKTHALSHGSYINLLSSRDRTLRKNAYKSMYIEYKKLINTIATAYSYNTKTDVVTSRIRKFKNSRASALFADNIEDEVYDNLVSVVNKNLPLLHKYMELRRKILKLNKLAMYDVYVPLFDIQKKDISFDEAKNIMIKGLAPLGDAYLSPMKKGLDAGWIDIYENKGKTSGAYSFGSYDSKPFILLNYTNTLKDVFTLVHEMGHSMHSYFTRKTQPYIYGDHSIFTAEIASTVNEKLLIKHLISQEKDDSLMKQYLINYHLEEFRTTLFRQTMFAEFEDMSHRALEQGESLTPDFLCCEYDKLNRKYFGENIDYDEYIKYEWARIPHFYNAFYVYKYATGYSAASAIAKIILEKGSDDYLNFLKTGSSNHPIELIKIAGVDMSKPKPIEDAMSEFSMLVDELERLVGV